MKVLFHFNVNPALQKWLRQHVPADWELICCPEGDETTFNKHWPGTTVLWHVLEPVTAARLKANTALRLVQKIGVGVNTIDLNAAATQGVSICNMPGVNSRAVAEMTLGLMLMASRRLGTVGKQLCQGVWPIEPSVQEKLFELGGKTVGLIGTGHVPRILAPWLVSMGVRVITHSRNPPSDWPYDRVSLSELLSTSDVVSLHIPLSESTRGMFNAQRFSAMKPGAIFINTARGELVDEAALTAALDSGHLSLACLDVFAQEPLPPGHALALRHDVIATPHMAWLTQDMFQRALSIAIENTRRLGVGSALLHELHR